MMVVHSNAAHQDSWVLSWPGLAKLEHVGHLSLTVWKWVVVLMIKVEDIVEDWNEIGDLVQVDDDGDNDGYVGKE